MEICELYYEQKGLCLWNGCLAKSLSTSLICAGFSFAGFTYLIQNLSIDYLRFED